MACLPTSRAKRLKLLLQSANNGDVLLASGLERLLLLLFQLLPDVLYIARLLVSEGNLQCLQLLGL